MSAPSKQQNASAPRIMPKPIALLSPVEQEKRRARNRVATMPLARVEKQRSGRRAKYEKQRSSREGRFSLMLSLIRKKCKAQHGSDDTLVVTDCEDGKHASHACDSASCPALCDIRTSDIPTGDECFLCGGEALCIALFDFTTGFTAANVRPICTTCQVMRNKKIADDLVQHARAIVAHRVSPGTPTVVAGYHSKLGQRWLGYARSGMQEHRRLDLENEGLQFVDEDGINHRLLTKNEMIELFKTDCYWCGRTPTLKEPNGVDRINNRQPYHEHNVVPACEICNKLRNDPNRTIDMPETQFVAHMQHIADHNT
jgi:hypothetical protein